MYYNINLDLCAIVLNVFSLYILFQRKDMKRNYNKIFFLLLVMSLLSGLFDISSSMALMNKNMSRLAIATLTSFYNFSHSMIPFLYVVYIILLSGVVLKDSLVGLRNFCVTVPIVFVIGLLSVNGIYHFVFSIDANKVYHREPMMYAVYTVALIYILQGIYYLIKYSKTIPKRKSVSIFALIFFGILGMIIQFFVSSMLVELFTEACTAYGILLVTEDESEVYSWSSHVYNKNAFTEDNNIYLNIGKEYRVIAIKMSDFDRYRLHYGTPNMNKIISKIAQTLETIAEDEITYDFSNGSFAIVLQKHSDYKERRIVEEIKSIFEKGWKYEKVIIPFKISISVISVPQNAKTVVKLISLVEKDYFIKEEEEDNITDNPDKPFVSVIDNNLIG